MTTEPGQHRGDTDVTRPVPRPARGRVSGGGQGIAGPRMLGDYELHERLGEGGMGVVWRATDRRGREVAIKVLREHIAHDEHARERLRREVHTLARVHHPRVAAVIDADVDGPAPYIVTEFVDGPPLDEVVESRGPLRGEALLRLGRGLGEALRAIHGAGIVHRDLKPGNVLLVERDGHLDPVVIDFGIAQVADDVRLTMTGMVMGTPGYLSPEVVEGGDVGEATDWWGWAATLAFAASGQPPFGRGPLTVVLDRVLRGRLQLEGVDPRLAPLLAAALDPDPERRPTQAQVLDGLERYARHEDVTQALPSWATQVAPQRRPDPTRVAPARVADPWPDPPPRRPKPVPEVREQAAGPAAYPEPFGLHEVTPEPGEQGGPDPRIGRSARSGTLAALLVLFVGLATVAPVLAWGLFAVWGVLTRTVDRSLTGLVLRRHEAGRRRSDVPMLVLASPWNLLASLVTTAFALILPVAIAGLVALGVAWSVSISELMIGVTPDSPIAMGAAALVGGLVGWWGLGATALRRGSRTTLRGMVPAGLPTTVVATLCVVGGAALAAWAVLDGGTVSWWPLGPNFDPRQWLPYGFPL
ncbi:protein kinase domain-containing protein [Ornithinimicrobium panacihumi]|uniref:protein kinase domain-containing protein n=1 Tax=Ornithinimicrobium panacihumi TaxID=2008449 RepID=UPI003F89F9FB